MDWLGALESWPVAAALRTSFYAYPLVNAAHIFGLALILGAIVPLDLRLLGLFGGLPLGTVGPFLSRVAGAGLAIALVTGFLLFSVKPADYVDNPAFLTKIALVAAGTANALLLRIGRSWPKALATGAIGPRLRITALASAAIWIAALVSGRMIGFLE